MCWLFDQLMFCDIRILSCLRDAKYCYYHLKIYKHCFQNQLVLFLKFKASVLLLPTTRNTKNIFWFRLLFFYKETYCKIASQSPWQNSFEIAALLTNYIFQVEESWFVLVFFFWKSYFISVLAVFWPQLSIYSYYRFDKHPILNADTLIICKVLLINF